MEQHTANFDENERLKDGRPKAGIPAMYPRVTDKTLSKMINDTPKRVFQKTPEFQVDTGSDKFTDICCEYVLVEECINGRDDAVSWYQKLINTGRDACGFGVCAVYSPFELVDGSYRVGFQPIYWEDLFLEAFCTNVNTANHVFIRQWKTKGDIEEILNNTDQDVDDGWDRGMLQELLDQDATTPKTSKDAISSDLFEFYTYISKYEFITFSTALGDKILRIKENKSKRMRVVGLYYDYDGTNPMGRSMVDIGGDLQNLIDSDMQAYQFNRALALQPPVVVNGDIDSGDGIYMPNNVLVSDDPNTAVKPLVIDTSAVTNYPQLYSLQKSQMYNLIPNAGDTTVSSEATGGLASSKTPTGIKQNQNTESVIDNFFFKNAEAFLGAWGENALNIFFGEFDGVIELQLNNEYADKARAEDPERVSPTGKVLLDCSTATNIRVKVTSGSTRDVARDEDLQRLNSLVTMAGQSEIIAATIGTAGMQEIAKSMVKTSGVTNAGKIIEAINNNENPQMPGQEQPAPEVIEQPDPNAEALGELDVASKEQEMAQADEMHRAKLMKMANDIRSKQNDTTKTR